MNGFMEKENISYLFNCENYDDSYFADATTMAGALEDSAEISPDEYDDTYSTSIEEISHTFDIEVSLIKVLESYSMIAFYDSERDIHYFFEII